MKQIFSTKGIIRSLILAVAMTLGSNVANAQKEFFSTERPENLFTFGARIGVNATNITAADKVFNVWNKNSFGTGFDAGIVLSLNIRDYLAIQPGFFFQSRSSNYSYATTFTGTDFEPGEYSQMGHLRNYYFHVPVVASVRLNVSDDIRWNIDLGPDFQFKLKSDDDKVKILRQSSELAEPQTESAKIGFFDFGLRLGTGLTLKEHYHIGVSYTAGLLKAWKTADMGGHNKAWSFVVGYDF